MTCTVRLRTDLLDCERIRVGLAQNAACAKCPRQHSDSIPDIHISNKKVWCRVGSGISFFVTWLRVTWSEVTSLPCHVATGLSVVAAVGTWRR